MVFLWSSNGVFLQGETHLPSARVPQLLEQFPSFLGAPPRSTFSRLLVSVFLRFMQENKSVSTPKFEYYLMSCNIVLSIPSAKVTVSGVTPCRCSPVLGTHVATPANANFRSKLFSALKLEALAVHPFGVLYEVI